MDKDRVQQVLTNLLSNAIKFSPKGAPVIVHCDLTSENKLLVEVRDHGRGIDPQDQELIFQKFRQITNQKNPLVKGTGLGLAIAYKTLQGVGASITLKSPVPDFESGGTLFELRFEKSDSKNSKEAA
jgi:signal transduction histidine kinase